MVLKINMSTIEHWTTVLNSGTLMDVINIETVEEFKNIGSIIDENESWERVVENKIGEGRQTLNSVLCNGNILSKTKRLVYNAIDQRIMLHGWRHRPSISLEKTSL